MALGEGGEGSPRRWDEREALVEAVTTAGCTLIHPCEDRARSFVGCPPAGGGWSSGCEILQIVGQEMSWRPSVEGSLEKNSAESSESGPHEEQACIIEVISLDKCHSASTSEAGTKDDEPHENLTPPWSTLKLPSGMENGTGRGIIASLLKTVAALYEPTVAAGTEVKDSNGEVSASQRMGSVEGGLAALKPRHPSMASLVDIVFVPSCHVLILFRLGKQQCSIRNLVRFSAREMMRNKACALFVTYQILHFLDDSKARGVSFGYLSDAILLVDDSLWLAVPSLAPALGLGRSLDSAQLSMDLDSATRSWVRGSMSNYDYLMLLNCLAGRRMGDPCYHPILPWVTNFASRTPEGSNWRDLSRSKLRLTRGDEQLDSTFLGGGASAHHITESLSDLTCHMYLARRTPKHRLVKAVRSRWQPNEYPSSMQRMYEWTPDECIPQFFTDPSIFSSIHKDMPDLQVPRWASGPQDFVAWHRHVLESGPVSSNLHAWIDVTFGYKLNGKAAVEAKNVPLNDPKFPRDRGFAALFTEPHPCRASSVMEQLGRVTLPAMELDDDRASPQADDSTTGHSTKSISSVSSTRHHLRAGLAQAEYAESDSSFEPQEDVTAVNTGVGGTRPRKGLFAGLRRAIGDRVQDLEAIGRAGAGGVSAGLKAVAGGERGGDRGEGKRGNRVEKVVNNNNSEAEAGVAGAKKEDWGTVLANLEGHDDPTRSIMSISVKEDVEVGLSQLLDDLCEVEATRRCVEETTLSTALDLNCEEEGLWSCGLVAAQLTSGRIADLTPHGGIVAGLHGWELSADIAGRDGGALADLIARCTRRRERREEREGERELGEGLTELMRAALQRCRQNIEYIGVEHVDCVSGRASLVRGDARAGKGLARSILGHAVFPSYMAHVHALYQNFHEENNLVDAVLSFVRSQSGEGAGIRQEGIMLCLPIIRSLLSSPETRVDTLALVAPSLISTMPSKVVSPLFLPPLLDELGAPGDYIARDGLDAPSLISWLGCLGMSDFINLLLPRIIPLVASQDAAVAKRISDSLVHLASNVLGCVVSMQCIVEPLVALFGKLGSEHAVTAIDAIGTRFGECFCRDALVPRLLSLLPSSAQIDVSVSESDSAPVTSVRPPEPPLSSGGIRGLRAELLGRGNKSTSRESDAGRETTDRNMTSVESASPQSRTKGNGGSNAAGGALTADVVQALSNAISCLSPQGALQCLVVDSNLLVRQLSAPMRVQTATTAMLCSNAIARLCSRIGPEETRRQILPLLGAWFTSLNQVYGGDFGPGGNPLGLGGTSTVFSPGGSKMSEETRERHKEMIYSLYVPVYSLVPPSNVAHTQWRTALRQNIRNYILIEDILKDNFGWTSSSSSATLQIIPPMLVKPAEEGDSWVGPPHKMSRSDNNIVVLGQGGNGSFQGTLGRTFKGHTGVLRFCSSDRQERVIITGGRDGTVRVWSPQTSQCAGVYTGHRNTVYWGEVLGVNQTIASCDGEIQVWDAQVLQRLHTLRANLQSGHSAHFTAAHVHSASSGGAAACLIGCAERLPGPVAMKLFDIKTRNRRAELHLPPSINNISAIATEGDWVCLGSVTGQLVVVDLRSGAVREQWEGHDGPVTGIKIRAGSQVVSASSDRTVAVWNLEGSGIGTTARDWERAWESNPVSVWGSEQGEGESDQNRLFLTEPVVGLAQMGDRTVAALGQGLVFAEPPHVSESRLRSVRSPVTCVGSMAHSNWVIVGCEDGRSRCLY